MAELADALVLGTSGLPVQVQVLLSAFRKSTGQKRCFFVLQRKNFVVYLFQNKNMRRLPYGYTEISAETYRSL